MRMFLVTNVFAVPFNRQTLIYMDQFRDANVTVRHGLSVKKELYRLSFVWHKPYENRVIYISGERVL